MQAARMLITAMACTVAACSSSAAATGAQSAPPPGQVTLSPGNQDRSPAAAWPEFNQNAARTGVAAGLPEAGPLSRRWTASLDGAVYGQPLVVATPSSRQPRTTPSTRWTNPPARSPGTRISARPCRAARRRSSAPWTG